MISRVLLHVLQGTSGMSMNSASRAQLMQKLARGQALPGIPSLPTPTGRWVGE